MLPKYMIYFKEELEAELIKSLKRKGNSIKKGKFKITPQVEKFLIRKFEVTKKAKHCNILNQLELDQSIRSRHLDHDISSITDFKLRIGRKARVFYINETGIEKNLLEKSFLYWEFLRNIEMAQSKDLKASNDWTSRHKDQILTWEKNIN